MEATKPIQPQAKPQAKKQPTNKKNVKGIKNAFLVIIVCFVVAVCLFSSSSATQPLRSRVI